ncbi:MAG: stage II sporulation protein D [Clostridium sp.]
MKKVFLFILLIVCLMIGIPISVVGVSSMKKEPSLGNKQVIQTKPQEDKSEKTEVKAPINNSDNLNIKVYYAAKKQTITLPIEEYIKLVISSEMPASFHEEALKAQAIAARSFLVPKLKNAGGKGCPKANGADVCSEVHCQAFLPKDERMKKWGNDAEAKWRKVSAAVDGTKGQVLTYSGEIAKSIKYFSTSGGKTEDSQYVFGYSQPYLRSVDSKGEEVAPNFKSSTSIKREDFVSTIKSKHKNVKIDAKNLEKQIKITGKTKGERVQSIYIGGEVLTGVQMRSLFGLKSAGFTLSFDKANVIFNVQGYGHGVGMSQWGANEMGKAGKKYKDILTHYYTGITIEGYGKYIK